MSVVQNTLIGRTRQSIGGVTFTTWKGLNVMKSKAVSVANPKSDKQVGQRNKMKFAVNIFRQLVAVIMLGYKHLAVGKSEYNAFVSTNLKNGAINASGTTAVFNPSLLEIARGTLQETAITEVSYDANGSQAIVNFSSTLTGDKKVNDLANCVLLKSDGTLLGISLGNNERADAEADFSNLPALPVGTTVHAYLFFTSADGLKCSDSVHKTGTVQ